MNKHRPPTVTPAIVLGVFGLTLFGLCVIILMT